MAKILETPSVLPIIPFDPKSEKTIEFYYTDNQPIKNRVIITDNMTSNIIYDKKQDSMRLYVTIPANTLSSGKQYLIQIQVFDADENSSNLSEPILFYCYSNPLFSFDNINNGMIYRNASVNLLLNYSQKENEQLKCFQFFKYSYDKSLLSSSDMFYSSSLLSYSFYELKNNTTYFFRATGETMNGMYLDTGYIEVHIQYNVVPANIAFQVENIYKDGYIQLTTNIKSIGYELENGNYTLNDGLLTLSNNSLIYNEGFEIDNDFSLFIEAKKLPLGKFFTTNDDNISMSIINVCDMYYCKLSIKESDLSFHVSLPKARLSTDNGDLIVTDDGRQIEIINTSYDNNDFVVFEVKRINGYYSLNAYYKAEQLL